MLRKKEVLDNLVSLTDINKGHKSVNGHGPLIDDIYKFDKVKLYSEMPQIALVLKEIGLDNMRTDETITLDRFAKTKDGKVWNELETEDDYTILGLLIAISDAAGFIKCDDEIVNKNIEELTKGQSLIRKSEIQLMSDPDKRDFLGSKWIKFMNYLLKNFKVPVKGNLINVYSSLAKEEEVNSMNGSIYVLNGDYSIRHKNNRRFHI